MLKNLPHGVKISISRSITTAFEQYMKDIKWDEEKYDLETFIKNWRNYAENSSSWFDQIDDETKHDPKFHNELAAKMNEIIEKILTDEPTEEQIQQIDSLVNKLGIEDVNYTCKAEANYYVETLSEKLKEQK